MNVTIGNYSVRRVCWCITVWLISLPVSAGPFAPPGDTLLRHDLQLLNDAGVIDVPLTTWPVSWGDIVDALSDANSYELTAGETDAFSRVHRRVALETETNTVSYRLTASAASNPPPIRSFEDTPRANGEIGASAQWTGDRFAFNLSAAHTSNPADGDNTRPDDTYVGVALGNWMISAGWQQRWWGPGRDGSLILSNNARPLPAIAIQRNRSRPFETRWLGWIGPWTLNAFMGRLDDERAVEDALLFGVRASFRPLKGLEIGLSRTAQWCGDNRPCDASAFADLLIGNDNRGVNVNPEDEPGNQLAGVDLRWKLPAGWPLAIYAQWVGEDTRKGGPEIGSWLRQAGIEHWGTIGGLQHRSYIEVADTSCRAGGLGFSELEPNCAYEHSIYRSGYRYNGRPLGHTVDGDGLSYSIGSTLVQSADRVWNITVRHMEINRAGTPDPRHSLSATPQEMTNIQLSYERPIDFGQIYIGVGYRRIDDKASNSNSSDASAFLQWSTW